MNKQGMSTWGFVIGAIIAVVLLIISISLFANTTDQGTTTLNSYLEAKDFDNDGLNNVIDPCPCDDKNDPYAVRYVISDLAWIAGTNARGHQIFKDEVHNMSAIARDEIINYLALKNVDNSDVELHLPEPENSFLQSSLGTQPDAKLFCWSGGSGENDMCTPGDFERDFFKVKEDGAGTLFTSNNLETICTMSKDACIQKINDAAYLEDYESEEDTNV